MIRRFSFLAVLVSLIAGAMLAWLARYVFPYRAVTTHIFVDLPRRHAALAGTTIAFVTDTHIGPHFTADRLAPVRNALNAIRPDVVILGGDHISESPRFMTGAATMLGQIAATARLGAWGVLGNHDLANQRHRVIDPLTAQGIVILENEASEVRTDRGSFWLVGIDDAILGKPDLPRAYADVPVDGLVISVWHEPDYADRNAQFAPILQLSGHTHGGQVRLPRIGPLVLPLLGKKYVAGRHQLGEMTLYVSRGLGIYRPPIRLNCPPELVLVTLIA